MSPLLSQQPRTSAEPRPLRRGRPCTPAPSHRAVQPHPVGAGVGGFPRHFEFFGAVAGSQSELLLQRSVFPSLSPSVWPQRLSDFVILSWRRRCQPGIRGSRQPTGADSQRHF